MDMDVDEPRGILGPRRSFPTQRGRGASHSSRQSGRFDPYSGRPGFLSKSTSFSSADSVEKWEHDKSDLFVQGSSLYKPKLNPTIIARTSATSGASLRPFGSDTPDPSRPLSAPVEILVQSRPIVMEKPLISRIQGISKERAKVANEGKDLFSRLQLSSNSPRSQQQQQQTPVVKPKYVQPVYPIHPESSITHQRYEKAKAFIRSQIAKEGPTVVKVENLVEGTTAEDVKTAFQDFGEIRACRVESLNGGDLMAEMVFAEKKKADIAVKRLDGALADGKTLRVYTQDLSEASPLHPLNPANPNYDASRFGPPPEAETGALYSDALLDVPRASIVTTPVVSRQINPTLVRSQRSIQGRSLLARINS